MIKCKSNISTPDGLLFEQPLFNLNIIMPNKFIATQVNLLIGSIYTMPEPDNTEKTYFKSIYDFGTYTFNVLNPSFEQLELATLAKLQEIYPNATFEIV